MSHSAQADLLPATLDNGARRVAHHAADGATRSFVRGSGLLLGGRVIAIVLNLAVQVLTVRYLAKHEYGAFAFGLGVASIGSSLMLLGLGKSISRFVPIYQERRDYARMFGTIAVATMTVGGLALAVMVLSYGLRSVLATTLVSDPLSLALLLILIALAPISAFDHLLQNLVAIFARPRAIVLRRHVLGPALKLAAILLVVAVSGSVHLLAYGYVIGGVIGIGLYVSILLREWRRVGLLEHARPRRLQLPARELFGFSIPLMSAELPVLLRGSLAVVLLGYIHSANVVAEYRAVYPIAGLNLMVFQAFGFLFVPLAARMFARDDREGINRLYWHTCSWILVLTFPVFAATFSLATPVTVLLFGAEYINAGVLLTVLAAGYYCNAVFGFNADTLRVHGKVRYAVLSDATAAVTFLLLCALLVPRMNALGAAIAASASTVIHNVCNHAGLWLSDTGVRLPHRDFIVVASAALLLGVGLLIIQVVADLPLLAGIGLAALAALALLRLTRHLLNPEQTFPELFRMPFVRWLLT